MRTTRGVSQFLIGACTVPALQTPGLSGTALTTTYLSRVRTVASYSSRHEWGLRSTFSEQEKRWFVAAGASIAPTTRSRAMPILAQRRPPRAQGVGRVV